MMTNGDPEGRIFLSYLHTHYRFLQSLQKSNLSVTFYTFETFVVIRMFVVYYTCLCCAVNENWQRLLSAYSKQALKLRVTFLFMFSISGP